MHLNSEPLCSQTLECDQQSFPQLYSLRLAMALFSRVFLSSAVVRCIRLSRSLRAAPVASLKLFQSLGSRPAWPSIDFFLDDRILSSACTTFRPCGRRSPTALPLHQLSCTIDSLITFSTPLFTSITGSSAATTRPQPSLIQEGSGLRSMKPSTLRGKAVFLVLFITHESFSVLTTPERSSLSPHCLFRAACSLKTPVPADFLSSASDTYAHTHVCSSICRTSADFVLLILELLYYEDQFTADLDDYLPCPVSLPSRRRYSHWSSTSNVTVLRVNILTKICMAQRKTILSVA